MSDDEIVILFQPFLIGCMLKRFESTVMPSLSATIEVMFVEWCAFPDILFSDETRKFIGVSFPISKKYEPFVVDMARQIRDERFRYVSVIDDNCDRYVGFGQNNRLEIYWDFCLNGISCELASLDTGAWIYPSAKVGSDTTTIPLGFNLLAVGEILTAYNLEIDERKV